MEHEVTWRALLRDTYLKVDRRTLGLTRIALGFLLLMDLFRRTPDWLSMFSTKGVLPSQVILARPQSDGFTFFTAFNSPGELWCLWAVGLVTYVCLLFGYKTKVAQVVALFYVSSMNGRVLLIENGGYVVQNLLLLWTCFMPLGDRFSVDALLASWRRRRERTEADLNDRTGLFDERQLAPCHSFAMTAVLLQISAVYFFNVVHKTGPAWSDGTAVHFVLYNDRMITPLLASVRDYAPFWLIQLLTRGTLAIEAGLVLLLLSPLAVVWARRGVFFGMNALHLGFGMSFTLGPFAWSCCTFSTLMIRGEDWDLCARMMRRPARARVVWYDPESGAALVACRLLKRMDRFELLTFRAAKTEAEKASLANDVLAARRPDGTLSRGGRMVSELISALPLGPIVAWVPALPGLRHAIDGATRTTGRIRASKWLGLTKGATEDTLSTVGGPPSRVLSKPASVLRELLVLTMLAGALNQALVELWVARPLGVPQPEPLRLLSHRMRFLQGWFMFSPNPVMDDGTIVVDAVTKDGRHIDPFTGKEPNFDLTNAKSLRLNQIWGDYFNRIRMQGNAHYRDAMRQYMMRLPERTQNPSDGLVSGEVYWVQDVNPPLGQIRSIRYEKVKLFTFDESKLTVPDRGGS